MTMITLTEVYAAYGPGGYCEFADGHRMVTLLGECAQVLATRPFSYDIGHGHLFISPGPGQGSLLRVEVFFDGPFIEVSWIENWDEADGLCWVRREALRGPAERGAELLLRFLTRLKGARVGVDHS
jgi:hypothetical protein